MQDINWKRIEAMAANDLARLIVDSELYFDHQVEALAQHIYAMHEVRVILVAGPSSSGKTTFSHLLCDHLQHLGVKAHYIGMDDFFINRENVPFLPSGVRDYDSLAAMDLPLLHQVIEGVLNAHWVEIPKFDFVSGTRKAEMELLHLQEQDLVLIEGIHALNPALLPAGTDLAKICKVGIKPRRNFVFEEGTILPADELRLLRRTIRDYYTRGHSFAATAKQWAEVCAAESVNITPYMDTADYNIDSSFDYELFIYKQCLGNMLDDCDLPEYRHIRDAMREVSYVPDIHIPSASLLNEFAIKKQ